MEKSARPVNLNLASFKFPRMAIVSILHRISGVILFFSLPLLLYWLHQSLLSQESFVALQQSMSQPWALVVMWGLLVSVGFHVVAGVRHLLMDMGLFETLRASKISATIVLSLLGVMAVWIGVWLW